MLRAFLIIAATACCSFFLPPDNDTDKIVMKSAEGQLEAWLSKVKPGSYADFGFREGDDLENCGIAKPYRLITFNTDFYSGALDDNANYIDIKSEWRVPVTVKGEHRVLLTLDGNSGNYNVTGMGGAGLAKELEVKSASFSEENNFYILRIFPISADFFVSEHESSFAEAEFVPLESAKKAIPSLKTMNKNTYTLDEVQTMVKATIATPEEKKDHPKKKATAKKHKKK